MKKIYKICLVVLAVDLFSYWLLFHSGVVLPYINPTIEEYNKTLTSFPRDYGQSILWYSIHIPLSSLIGMINENFLVLAILQYPLILLGINAIITKRQKKT